METETNLPFLNQALFSNHFLIERISGLEFWNLVDVREKHATLAKTYEDFKTVRIPAKEANTCKKWIEPVLKILGYEFEPFARLRTSIPDYALFADVETLSQAVTVSSKPAQFYIKALTIVEAKYWERKLDDVVRDDRFDTSDASGQIARYLADLDVQTGGKMQWAILTNGRKWRLFYQKAKSKVTNFYEIDLVDLLQRPHEVEGDFKRFKYFLFFFEPAAFSLDVSGKNRLDRIMAGSVEYALEVTQSLNEKIFDPRTGIVIRLARGVLEYRKRHGTAQLPTQETLDAVFSDILTFLYRLLFIFYAEARELLPLRNPHYEARSLRRIAADAAEIAEGRRLPGEHSTNLWTDLEDLFEIIDKGDRALEVPIYNGGLFKSQLFGTSRVTDTDLAPILDCLARDFDKRAKEKRRIDYSALKVQQLGSIYEGLLEFKLRVAKEKMIALKEKGKERWFPASYFDATPPASKVLDEISCGNLYLENTKHERKSTGSYYTPEFVVDYIVEHTLASVLHERLAAVKKIFGEIADLQKKRSRAAERTKRFISSELRRKDSEAFEGLFNLKVLDLAMGSGHFLVRAADFISETVIPWLGRADVKNVLEGRPEEAPRDRRRDPENPILEMIERERRKIVASAKEQGLGIDESKLTDNNLIKRMVMKRCIFGVDLNPMAVELAKVALWLDSFTLGAPLSFLDHHLKCGNSLIGSTLQDLEKRVKGLVFAEELRRHLGLTERMLELAAITDSTVAEVEKSAFLYAEAKKQSLPLAGLFDVLTSASFGNTGAAATIQNHADEVKAYIDSAATGNPVEIPVHAQTVEVMTTARNAADENRFFHWELEFPEVWRREGEPPEGGFDAVIGNPPYVRQEELGDLKEYLKKEYEVYNGMADLYTYFFERGIKNLRPSGVFGMITSNKFMRSNYGKAVRKFLHEKVFLQEIVDFGELPVFPEVTAYPCIFIVENAKRGARQTSFSQIRALPERPDFKWLEEEASKGSSALPPAAFEGENWTLAGPEEGLILRKMEAVGVPLGEYLKQRGVKINYGIKTGFNEAFIIDRETRDRLIKEDPKSAEIIKPLIVGDDVRRYRINFSERYLIFVRRGTDINRYPAIENYLSQWRRELAPKANRGQIGPGRKPGGYKWYEIQDTVDYYSDFEKPKILYPDIAMSPRFGLDNAGYFPEATCFEIPANDGYLLAILNSTLMQKFVELMTPKIRGNYFRFKTVYLKSLPIRRIDSRTPDRERKELLGDLMKEYRKALANEIG